MGGLILECNDSVVAKWQKQSFCTPYKDLVAGGKPEIWRTRSSLFVGD